MREECRKFTVFGKSPGFVNKNMSPFFGTGFSSFSKCGKETDDHCRAFFGGR